jgi:predicted secreted protein
LRQYGEIDQKRPWFTSPVISKRGDETVTNASLESSEDITFLFSDFFSFQQVQIVCPKSSVLQIIRNPPTMKKLEVTHCKEYVGNVIEALKSTAYQAENDH